jgi:hypothetical protein
MMGTMQNFLIVVISVACALSFMAAVNHFWPAQERRTHNDLIGWQLSVLGTTYAVIIGFMLYTVWTNFGAAELNADAEANSLTNLFRIADGLPAVEGSKIKELTRAYADAVVNREWKEMADAHTPTETADITQQMWPPLLNIHDATQSQIAAEDHALSELRSLAGYRRIRMAENATVLPGVLWFVLLSGAAVTIASSCMFGASNGALHLIQVAAFTLLISLVLIAVADINRPYQGSVHVNDYPFRRAQDDMK